MSHENSITVEVDGRFVNLRTVGRGGRQITRREAIRMFRAGEMNSLGNRSFATQREAVTAAERRSRSDPRPRRNPFRGMK